MPKDPRPPHSRRSHPDRRRRPPLARVPGLVALLWLALAGSVTAQAAPESHARIPSHCIALAGAQPQLVPVQFAPVAADQVLIRYLNHASFAIVAEDGTVAVSDFAGHTGTAALVPDVDTS